jgi:L-aminopeptidase/D-esterase-like protein
MLKLYLLVIFTMLVSCLTFSSNLSAQTKPRARDLGIPFEGTPGPLNAITDVKGVEVGHTTLISGAGKLEAGNGSGDIFIVFSTANPEAAKLSGVAQLEMLANEQMNALFSATVQAVEETIVNAMIAAETMTGIDDHKVIAIPHQPLQQILKKYNRLIETGNKK